MDNPEYIKINNRLYKINADYRNVLKYNEIFKDETISDYEKILGGICIFYGKDVAKETNNIEALLNGIKMIIDGRPSSLKNGEEIDNKYDMDFKIDMGLIISSMWSEYKIDITKEKIHWWTFYDLLNGLSSECALNRVRDIRNKDLSKITDKDELAEYKKLKKIWSLETPTKEMSDEQKRSSEEFYKAMGL